MAKHASFMSVVLLWVCLPFLSGYASGETDITDWGGQITAQYYDSPSGEEITKVIDNNVYTKYLTLHARAWIQFEADSPAVVTRYTITAANDFPERDPKDWTLMGSNDGRTWTVLDSRQDEDFPDRFRTREFSLNSSVGFVFYRLEMANNGGGVLQLAEWRLWASGGGGSGTAPVAPSNLTAFATCGRQINLTWLDNSITEEGFRIERMTGDGSRWTWSATVSANTTSYFSAGLSPLTQYYYRVRAENSFGNSEYSNTASAITTSDIPPPTWKEHWFEHNQLLQRLYYDYDVAIYYDDAMSRSITWPHQFLVDMWRYTKSVYGDYGGENRLYAIFHQGKYGGGHPSTYFDASHDYRNVIDCGAGSWGSATGWNVDVLAHEVGHIVEGASNGIHKSPAFGLWGDSKWAEIYIYDVYKGIGWDCEAIRWYDHCRNITDNFPRSNTYWFRDWFYPIYRDHGGSTVLPDFFVLLAQYFPKNGSEYARAMNWGEFVHFWSAAAGTSLKRLATTAFGWSSDWEKQFRQAQMDFPIEVVGVPSAPLVDTNGDGKVDIADLIKVVEYWGQNEPSVDINSDGMVDEKDLEIVVTYWGHETYDPTLAAHWRLDEVEGAVALDSAGTVDGMLAGDPIWQPLGGRIGGALLLDGLDDYIATGLIRDPSEGPFTVLAWVQGGAPGQVIVSQSDGADWLMVGEPDGALRTDLKAPGRSMALASQTVITDGAWHRVGLMWDGTRRILYVDDIEVARDKEQLGSLLGTFEGLHVGSGSGLRPDTFWFGLIDDVRVCNRAVKP